jgi:hypothetical protein
MPVSSTPFRALAYEIGLALAVDEAAEDHAAAARLYGLRSEQARAAYLRFAAALSVPGAREAYARLQASVAATCPERN